MAVTFPSDYRYPHFVSEITRGSRWAVVTWFAVEDPVRHHLLDAIVAVPEHHRPIADVAGTEPPPDGSCLAVCTVSSWANTAPKAARPSEPPMRWANAAVAVATPRSPRGALACTPITSGCIIRPIAAPRMAM